jgi:hypothetical protein
LVAKHAHALPTVGTIATIVATLAMLSSSPRAECEDEWPTGFWPTAVRSDSYKEPGFAGTVIYVDEDSFLFPTSDQDYTTGFQFTFAGSFAKKLRLPLRGLDYFTEFQKVHDRICDDDHDCYERGYDAHTLLVGLTYFTPRKGDAGDPDCPPEDQRHGCVLALEKELNNDRPYASLLYATVMRETARGRNAWVSDFTFGVMGLGIARLAQTKFHEGIGHDVTPGGWSHQISNGGEPTFRYRAGWRHVWLSSFATPVGNVDYDYATPVPNSPYLPNRCADFTTDVEANVGYYTNLQAGGRLRLSPIGRISSAFWSAQRQPVVSTTRAPTSQATERKIAEFYVWISGGVTAWAYNALLSGQFRHSDVTLPYILPGSDRDNARLNTFLWDWQAGGTIRFGRGAGCLLRHVGLTYQISKHTAAFTGPHSRRHGWGGIYLGIYPDR